MKLFLRRFWWIGIIILGVGIILFVLAAYGGYRHDQSQPRTADGTLITPVKVGQGRAFTTAELAAAETVLANGFTIEDPQNDWFQFAPGQVEPDGRPDNLDPYPLGWTDCRSVSVGSDQNYLYIKFQYWDAFPTKAVSYHGDLIWSTGADISITFNDQAGVPDRGTLSISTIFATTQDGQWVPAKQITIGQLAMITVTGVDQTGEETYKKYTLVGMTDGGPGHDYLLAAYPLSLFNLKPGDTVSFTFSTETGSVTFHHEALDPLLSSLEWPKGAIIKYTLGSNVYEVVVNPQGTK